MQTCDCGVMGAVSKTVVDYCSSLSVLRAPSAASTLPTLATSALATSNDSMLKCVCFWLPAPTTGVRVNDARC
jgi:hypothetical protein